MSIGQEIKHIIGDIFISPLTDIIYEYAKCHYCNHKKMLVKQNDAMCQYCIYVKTKILAFIDKVGYINYRPGKILIFPDLNKMQIFHNKDQNYCSDISLTIDQLAYAIVHLDIYKMDICCINIDHTSKFVSDDTYKLLQFIGIDATEYVGLYEPCLIYKIILP